LIIMISSPCSRLHSVLCSGMPAAASTICGIAGPHRGRHQMVIRCVAPCAPRRRGQTMESRHHDAAHR
jgi:hypothetical protein